MKILVGYDGSRTSKAAVQLAIDHARAFSGRIVLVRSLIERTDTDYDRIDRAREDLAHQAQAVRDAGIDCEQHLLIRDLTPGEDIVEFARDNAVDQIVIGVKQRSKIGKVVFGSNAQYVIIHAPCPVVTVK